MDHDAKRDRDRELSKDFATLEADIGEAIAILTRLRLTEPERSSTDLQNAEFRLREAESWIYRARYGK